MRKPILTIFYPFNPWHTSIGGIETVIRSFVKYSPSEFEVRLVGTEIDPSQPLGVWRDTELAGKEIRFMPLFTLQKYNRRNLVPATVKYTTSLLGGRLASGLERRLLSFIMIFRSRLILQVKKMRFFRDGSKQRILLSNVC
jgi:hypothetical protein